MSQLMQQFTGSVVEPGRDMRAAAAPGAVQRLQDELLKMPQADIKTVHVFKPGVYERTITIPPWTVLTGAEHKTPYRVRLDAGVIAVNTEAGISTLAAPCEFDAPAGVQRVGRVFADEVIWTDIYSNPDDCRDIAELEDRLYVVPPCGLGENRLCIERDRQDFALFLSQLGMSQAEMNSVVQIDIDLMPMPEGFDVELRDSPLDGKGLFALREFARGELICPGRIDGKRTPAGRFTNHSAEPNAEPVKDGDDINAVALRVIRQGEEILVDYRDSMLVNFGIDLTGEQP